ncbi:MAG TPA: hypothetical protein VGP63_19085 [Planctomycetaceae bacterium]|jgi:hypothetical protein|nr:hypothetical protein [Planctomycetaceae bacterium]
MSDEPHKAEWHMTEETVPERPYNGPLGPKIALGFVIVFVVGVLLVWLFPWLVIWSYERGHHPPEVRPLPW